MKKRAKTEFLFLAVLILYPLRHINWGLDLWDTGYNYANFQYMGLEHMDPMWLFSTYLANGVGHLLTKLPFAGGLVGMNFYTGLFVSLLAVMGYLFCTRSLKIPSGITFLGELAAVSLCWCPTALLYNYLTYVLFLGCLILLYKGLSREKMGCLFGAGICLGVNVFVRFSNLPEAAMIVGVWAYAVITGLEKKEKKSVVWKRAVRHTLWCLAGYAAALTLFLGYLQIRYGLDAYAEGIRRLFAMTDNATDYKAASMLMGMFGTYAENLYWVLRIGIIVFCGLFFFGLVSILTQRSAFIKNHEKLEKGITVCSRILWGIVCIAMLGWLYYRGFCSLQFYSYGSILRPGILFLMLTLLIALIRIFHRNSLREEKLISGMVFLTVLLTSIGSNNGVYPSLNNLFVAAPYTFWQCYRFFSKAGEYRRKGIAVSSLPVKGVLAAFLAMFLFQSALFGACFVFAEGTGVQQVGAEVENNAVLRGVKMSPERAKWLTEISAYIEDNNLQGREVILYGQLPALSYYLQMPSAFNPWSDLRSYSQEAMEQALLEVEKAAAEKGEALPVIILENHYVQYLSGGEAALEELGLTEKRITEIKEDRKWEALDGFMERLSYRKTFSNEKFAVWETGSAR